MPAAPAKTGDRSLSNSHRARRTRWIWPLAAGAAALSLAACDDGGADAARGGAAPQQQDAAASRGERGRGGGGRGDLVSVVPVKIETVNDRMESVGTARAQQRATLLTEAAGVVEEVLLRPGAHVEKDAPLLRLDRRAEQIAIQRATSAVELAKATLARLERLGANATDVARQDARNALALAEADLAQARYEYDRKEVRAPFAGVVGISDVYRGQYAPAGTEVATLDDRERLILAFTLPERAMTLDLLGKKVRASARSERGRFYEGEIVAVDSRVNEATRTLRVEAALPNPEGRLLPGGTYAVTVMLPGEPAPSLPALAVQWDRGGAHVWRVAEDDTAARVDVVILKREGERIALKAPLKDGERVVYEGGDRLTDGARVTYRAARGAEAASDKAPKEARAEEAGEASTEAAEASRAGTAR